MNTNIKMILLSLEESIDTKLAMGMDVTEELKQYNKFLNDNADDGMKNKYNGNIVKRISVMVEESAPVVGNGIKNTGYFVADTTDWVADKINQVIHKGTDGLRTATEYVAGCSESLIHYTGQAIGGRPRVGKKEYTEETAEIETSTVKGVEETLEETSTPVKILTPVEQEKVVAKETPVEKPVEQEQINKLVSNWKKVNSDLNKLIQNIKKVTDIDVPVSFKEIASTVQFEHTIQELKKQIDKNNTALDVLFNKFSQVLVQTLINDKSKLGNIIEGNEELFAYLKSKLKLEDNEMNTAIQVLSITKDKDDNDALDNDDVAKLREAVAKHIANFVYTV